MGQCQLSRSHSKWREGINSRLACATRNKRGRCVHSLWGGTATETQFATTYSPPCSCPFSALSNCMVTWELANFIFLLIQCFTVILVITEYCCNIKCCSFTQPQTFAGGGQKWILMTLKRMLKPLQASTLVAVNCIVSRLFQVATLSGHTGQNQIRQCCDVTMGSLLWFGLDATIIFCFLYLITHLLCQIPRWAGGPVTVLTKGSTPTLPVNHWSPAIKAVSHIRAWNWQKKPWER